MSGDRLWFILLCILAPTFVAGQMPASDPIDGQTELNHKRWALMLQQYVDESGKVNYTGFKQDESALADYLNYLGKHQPLGDATKEELLAYYINLYNAATIKLILEHYPVSSIRDIKQPWGRKWIAVGDQQYSLNQIEHRILRKLEEPRIHFAINCASISCPKLLKVPFEAKRLEQQLEEVTRGFINDSLNNKITPDKISLSALFKWYRNDFTSSGSLQEYIRRYSKKPFAAKAKVEFIKYDWGLNEQ
ncbi:MAG: DUF547 domain-containing protein [Eudoraea sp.]|nr:DUF547 domain-containing protein [Eudoraea sp.]